MSDISSQSEAPDHEELVDLEASASAAARLMKLLSSEPRLVLLCRLIEGECSVSELADYLKLAPSATSQHLAKLRAEGVVTARRDGQTIYYEIADPKAVRVIDTLCELYRKKRPPRGRGRS
jgi:DNA-binding transcriptional ArsR family regulator